MTDEIKVSFPNPIDLDGLTRYISDNLDSNKLASFMSEVDDWIRSGGAADESKEEKNLDYED